MKMTRLVAALAVAAIVSMGGLAVFTAPAQASTDGYYSVPYSGTLYYHYNFSTGGSTTYAASFNEWANAGYPSPMPAPTDYVKYPWSSTIYAVSDFGPGDKIQKQLAFQEWQRAGYPGAHNTGFVDGTKVYKFPTSADIIAKAPDGAAHALSYQDWANMGFMAPEYRTNEGYQKLSWRSSIAYVYDLNAGYGYTISYADWQNAGFPTPQIVNRFARDTFCTYSWSPTIYYYGMADSGPLSYNEWQAAGFPAPTSCL